MTAIAAGVPVICCGGATVGGAGKTTVVDELARWIPGAHIVMRGYGGFLTGPARVGALTPYALVGDEACVHAAAFPTWIGRHRGLAARAAAAAGARAIILDDGLQNRSIEKDISLLIINGTTGLGNGRLLPFGPLRERFEPLLQRCAAAIIVGEDRTGMRARIGDRLPVVEARLQQVLARPPAAYPPVFAFAGIAFPEKFYATLRTSGLRIAGTRDFPNHHPYTRHDWQDLLARAERLGARLITTPKDAVRLPYALVRDRLEIADTRLVWQDAAPLRAVLRQHGVPLED